jgi:hypothetical protein
MFRLAAPKMKKKVDWPFIEKSFSVLFSKKNCFLFSVVAVDETRDACAKMQKWPGTRGGVPGLSVVLNDAG